MFAKESPNRISSSDGWSVEVLGITGLRYDEPGASYYMDAELLVGEPVMVVLASRMYRVLPDGTRMPVARGKARRVVGRIRAAMKWDGHDIDVAWSG